jgi:hypothetical protein
LTDIVLARSNVPTNFDEQMRMAEVLAGSSLLPTHLRHQPANVLIILQGAQALDVPAFWALQSMHVIEGKLSMAAELMRALVVRAGHRFKIVERSRTRAVVEIHRNDRDEPYRFEFTWQDAIDGELAGKKNWKKFPKAMLLARATTGAVRDECADVLFGVVYSPDELGAVTDDEGNPEYVEGSIVQVPIPEKINEIADQLVAVDLENFAAAWRGVIDLGWALEKIPTSDLSLVEYAAELLRDSAKDTEDDETLRLIWKVAKACDLMAVDVSSGGTATGGEDKPIRLGDYLKARGEFVASLNRAKADIAAQDAEFARRRDAAENPVVVVDLPAEDIPVTEEPAEEKPEPFIDTEEARRLREAATASWGDA